MNIKMIIIFLVATLFLQNIKAAGLYDLKTMWLKTDGQKSSVAVAKDHYVIIGMVYTGCAHACPLTISKIQNILSDLGKNEIKDVHVVLASFDVKRDRPDHLSQYQKSRNLSFDQWHFLSAQKESDARELAVTLGISYKDLGDGDFSHSNVITLLNPQGEVIASIDNLNSNSDHFIEAIRRSEKGTKK